MGTFAENGIVYRGAAAKSDIGAVYTRFDALLLVLGTGRYVTSGKVYEYASAGVTIVWCTTRGTRPATCCATRLPGSPSPTSSPARSQRR